MTKSSESGVQVVSDAPLQVGVYGFCAPDSIEGTDRDFEVTLLQNRTCLWEDEHGRAEARADQFLMIRGLAGSMEAVAELNREKVEFTFECKVGEEVYWLIIEKEALSAQGHEPTQEMCDKIDEALAPYFWRDINPRLSRPLTKT
jgi:hypothetical protein